MMTRSRKRTIMSVGLKKHDSDDRPKDTCSTITDIAAMSMKHEQQQEQPQPQQQQEQQDMWLQLPEEAWIQIGLLLQSSPESLLNLLSTCKTLHLGLGRSTIFWKSLLLQLGDISSSCAAEGVADEVTGRSHCLDSDTGTETTTSMLWEQAKLEWRLQSYVTFLPRAQWIQVMDAFRPVREDQSESALASSANGTTSTNINSDLPTDRQIPAAALRGGIRNSEFPPAKEGHSACRLGNYAVVTGGYCDDGGGGNEMVYVQKVLKNRERDGMWHRIVPDILPPVHPTETGISQSRPRPTRRSQPADHPSDVYGASLTPLDDHRAIRFGGFTRGGYAGQTSQVVILSMHSDTNPITISWQVIQCRLGRIPLKSSNDTSTGDEEEQVDLSCWKHRIAARAYHTATLLFRRYLLILGGMQHTGSTFEPLLLDTHTWTWATNTSDIIMPHPVSLSPSPRFGHSVVTDRARQRLVLFGGGSGNDLLRTGQDNCEIWQLDIGRDFDSPPVRSNETWPEGMPWKWTMLHADPSRAALLTPAEQHRQEDEERQRRAAAALARNEDQSVHLNNSYNLSTVERLVLGRCHFGVQVSRDMAVLVCGSSRPSSNDILGYQLSTDRIVRIPLVDGRRRRDGRTPPQSDPPFRPRPRLSFVGIYWRELGYLWIHGGYSTQLSETITEPCILDLAPLQLESCYCPSKTRMRFQDTPWSVQESALPHSAITEEQVEIAQRRRFGGFAPNNHFWQDLMIRTIGEGRTGGGGGGDEPGNGNANAETLNAPPLMNGAGAALGILPGLLANLGHDSNVDVWDILARGNLVLDHEVIGHVRDANRVPSSNRNGSSDDDDNDVDNDGENEDDDQDYGIGSDDEENDDDETD